MTPDYRILTNGKRFIVQEWIPAWRLLWVWPIRGRWETLRHFNGHLLEFDSKMGAERDISDRRFSKAPWVEVEP